MQRHIVSLALAVVSAILVIIAGRSCTKSAYESNKKGSSQNNTTQKYHLITEAEYGTSDQSVLGVGSGGSANDPAQGTTEREYVTVTNIFGDVVETIPVTTPEEANMPTTTLSILDEYNRKNGGLDNDTNVQEYTTYIAPATNIVIEVG